MDEWKQGVSCGKKDPPPPRLTVPILLSPGRFGLRDDFGPVLDMKT